MQQSASMVDAAQRRARPSLEPIWTDYRNLQGHPKTAFRAVYSPVVSSSSPRSAPPRPSPLHPAQPPYDASVRGHERAMVDRLDPRARLARPAPDVAPRYLRPICEQHVVVAATDVAERSPSTASLLPTPAAFAFACAQGPRRQSLSEDASRSVYLSSIPASPFVVRDPAAAALASRASEQVRRMSLPPTPTFARRRRSSIHNLRDHLHAWGQAYYGNAATADCFVVALALRRRSIPTTPASFPAAHEDVKREAVDGTTAIRGGPPSALSKEDDRRSDSPRLGPRITVRARVRPRAPERKPFVLQRTFDLDELRSTIPQPTPALPLASTPASVLPPGSRRASADHSVRTTTSPLAPRLSAHSAQRRNSSVAGGPWSPAARETSPLPTSKALPIHLPYARVHFPVLAALMLSGHVREGDVIDLPMPRPEAWPQTVAYAYTGQGEATEAVKENILYLAGRV